MSIRATRAVYTWSEPKLTRELMLALADRAHHDGVAWPGRAELLQRLRVSDRHLRRIIDAAIAAGELEERVARDGRVVYRLRLLGLLPLDVERLASYKLVLVEPFAASEETDVDVQAPRVVRTAASASADGNVRSSRARSLPEKNVKGTSETVSDGSPEATVQELVAFYVNESRRLRGEEPVSAVKARIGREIKKALSDDGCTADEVRAGLTAFVTKRLDHPSAFPPCIRKKTTKGARHGAAAFAGYDHD